MFSMGKGCIPHGCIITVTKEYTYVFYETGSISLRSAGYPGCSLEDCLSVSDTPVIVTLRSKDEGGEFRGSSARWEQIVEPYLHLADYVDIEEKYRKSAPGIAARGCSVIASWHTFSMPSLEDLTQKHRILQEYGRIPKIITVPGNEHDILALCRFTTEAEKPLITGTMGPDFRFSRLFLLFFGSWAAFCHCGRPAAPGQFHISEAKEVLRLLG
jgi:3-dehydroquinate dehydratase-1